jgi:hypothetical protein
MSAASQHLVLVVAVPVEVIGAWLRVVALLLGVAGLVLLVPALIGRIRRRTLRLATAWTAGLAAAGRSSLSCRGSRTRTAGWMPPVLGFTRTVQARR